MHYYAKGTIAVQKKADLSPVTEADLAADRYIRERLEKLAPDIPMISEEADPRVNQRCLASPTAWIVDPLDGTEGFADGSQHGEFAVSIGLLRDLHPEIGVIYLPVRGQLFFAKRGLGAFSQHKNEPVRQISCAETTALTLIVNRHMRIPDKFQKDPLTRNITVQRMAAAGKFAAVAEGRASLYVRNGRTSEWDTAAGHCLVEAAGGQVVDFQGNPLRYGKQDFHNPPFVAFAPAAQNWRAILDLLL
jgi:3'(2'), 5'-bisphosphate nucleotidase